MWSSRGRSPTKSRQLIIKGKKQKKRRGAGWHYDDTLEGAHNNEEGGGLAPGKGKSVRNLERFSRRSGVLRSLSSPVGVWASRFRARTCGIMTYWRGEEREASQGRRRSELITLCPMMLERRGGTREDACCHGFFFSPEKEQWTTCYFILIAWIVLPGAPLPFENVAGDLGCGEPSMCVRT